MKRRSFIILLLVWYLVVFLFFSLEVTKGAIFPSFPLDDSWIHFSFARNLAQYSTFGLNISELSTGSTSPLWVFLLAFFYKMTHQMIFSALLLGALLVLFLSLAIYRLALLFFEDERIAFYSAFFSLISGRFIWGGLSGMEVPLFAFLTVLAITYHEKALKAKRVSLVSGLLFGLATLARPEGYLLFFLALLDIYLRLGAASFKAEGMRLLKYIGIYLCLSLPYVVFSMILTAKPFCGSYYSKMLSPWTMHPHRYLLEYMKVIFLDNPILFIFIFPGMLWFIRHKKFLVPFWLIGFPLCASFLAPILIHHARYNMPMVPLYVMTGFIGLRWCVKRSSVLFSLFLISIGLWALTGLYEWSRRYASDAASIHGQHVRIATWLKNNVPQNMAIATNDIGAISYLSERKIIDLCGIIKPDVLKIVIPPMRDEERRAMLRQYLLERNARYLAIYPEWFPWIVKDSHLEKVFAAHLSVNTIAGGDTMEVYKIK